MLLKHTSQGNILRKKIRESQLAETNVSKRTLGVKKEIFRLCSLTGLISNCNGNATSRMQCKVNQEEYSQTGGRGLPPIYPFKNVVLIISC